MNILKITTLVGLSIAMTSCMIVPPEMSGTTSVYSVGSAPSQQPVIIQQPPQQPVIIQQPVQPVIIQPDHTKQHCYDPQSGEYLKVPPHSNRCREWLHNNQRERERRHLCIDRNTGHHVHGVPANSPECHRINNPKHHHEPPRHQPQPPPAPPAKQPPPQQQPIQQPAAPIKQPPQQQPIQQPAAPIKQPPPPAPSVCIDKRTGKPVDGVSANDLRCAKINR